VRGAPTFARLEAISRTAAGLQHAYRPVKEVADRAGIVWVTTERKLDDELKAVGKAKGGQPYQRGKSTSLKSRDVEAPTRAEVGIDHNRSARAAKLGEIPERTLNRVYKELQEADKPISVLAPEMTLLPSCGAGVAPMIDPAAVPQRHTETDVAALGTAVPGFDVRAGESAFLRQGHARLLLPRCRLRQRLRRRLTDRFLHGRGIESGHGLWRPGRGNPASQNTYDGNHAHLSLTVRSLLLCACAFLRYSNSTALMRLPSRRRDRSTI
jgi:hypothetical protein